MTSSQVAVWDLRFNHHSEGGDLEETILMGQFNSIAKKWTFQLEQGEKTGYKHYQCRISLFKKTTKKQLLKMIQPPPNYCEPTANHNYTKEAFYCMKAQTRLAGPWKDDDPAPAYVPIQYRHINEDTFYPYQRDIYNNNYYNYRTINHLTEFTGNAGKSTIACLTVLKKSGLYVPPMNDAQKLVEYVFCVLEHYKDGQTPKCFIIDLPRSMSKECLYGMYSAIEQFKTGFIYDTRYKGKSRWIDSPNIWVFSNEHPDQTRLSSDRWNIWTLDKEKKLVKYEEDEDEALHEPTNLYKFILNKKRIL